MHTVTPEILDIIRNNAPEGRKTRQVAPQTVQLMKDCGFFRIFLPKRWGGLEFRPQQFFEDQILIAEADMSAAWIGGVLGVHPFQIAMMDERAQADVYAEHPDALVSSSYNPVGAKVEEVDGGVMVSGRWGWSSGSEYCTWALLGGVVPNEGYRTFLIPRSDYRIEDTWFVAGLEGTGSNDIVIDEPVFVPHYRSHKRIDGFNCVQNQENPMYKLPWAQIFVRAVNTAALGSLKTGLKSFISSRTGSATTDPTKLAGDVETQARIAKVANIIDEIETVFFKNLDEMEKSGWQPTMDKRIFYRYQASLVIEKCLEGIDTLYDVAGGRSVFLGHPLHDIWKDIHVARSHVANNPSAFARNLGGTLLGLENNDLFI